MRTARSRTGATDAEHATAVGPSFAAVRNPFAAKRHRCSVQRVLFFLFACNVTTLMLLLSSMSLDTEKVVTRSKRQPERARKLRPVRAAQIGMVYLPGSASPLTGWLNCVAASMREAGLDAAVQPLGLAPPGGSKTQKRGDKERADGDQLWGAFTTTSKSLSSLQKASRTSNTPVGAFVTVLRPPTQRLWALYHMQPEMKEVMVTHGGPGDALARRCVRDMSLEQAMSALDCVSFGEQRNASGCLPRGLERDAACLDLLSNALVRQFGGTPVDSDALERAKQQLASFAVVGLYDAANKTSLLMEAAFPSLAKVAAACQLPPPSSQFDFGTSTSPQHPLLGALQRHNSLDEQLYRFAVRLFETSWANYTNHHSTAGAAGTHSSSRSSSSSSSKVYSNSKRKRSHSSARSTSAAGNRKKSRSSSSSHSSDISETPPAESAEVNASRGVSGSSSNSSSKRRKISEKAATSVKRNQHAEGIALDTARAHASKDKNASSSLKAQNNGRKPRSRAARHGTAEKMEKTRRKD